MADQKRDNRREAAGKITATLSVASSRRKSSAVMTFYQPVTSGGTRSGYLRLEGRDYIVQDGDVIVFKFAT